MSNDEYSLEELSEATGITRRTIRSYIQQGLVEPPDSIGRNARYGRKHLVILLAIRQLKVGNGLTLPEIRSALLFADPEVVEELASEVGEAGTGLASSTAESSGSALEYLQALKEAQVPRAEADSETTSRLAPPSHSTAQRVTGQTVDDQSRRRVGSPVERLLRNIERLGDGRPVARKSRGEQWVRIPVTPDIEISVRGATSPEQVARLEAIADRLRTLLTEENEYEINN
jgi:DNA-binding transcriptional MerR regulator